VPHRTLTAEELTDYLHLAKGDVEKLIRETDIPHEVRGGRLLFRRGDIDEWASKRILGLPAKRLDVYHEKSMRAVSSVLPEAALIPQLLRADYIDLQLTSKTPSSVVRDMVNLANSTGRVLDREGLLTSVREREEMCSTGLPGGIALLHSRQHLPYQFEGSFLVFGRTIQSVPFGAPDGRSTRLFFLICCQDERLHLHTLARLCVLVMKTDVVSQLLHAADRDEAYSALLAAEQQVIPAAEEAEPPRKSRRSGNG
jgi:nitrogen PTS system EIIA component